MKDILTFKSGKFYFCDSYDRMLIDPMVARNSVLNETVSDLPILPELASRLEPEIMYSSVSGTARIEGNSITEEDVERIARGEEVEQYTHKDKQEIKNLLQAYAWLSEISPSDEPFLLSEEIIKEIHATITSHVPHENNIPGVYRNGMVHVGDTQHGGVYPPPRILDDIKNLMAAFIQWINSEEIINQSPWVRASLAHYHFCLIHPFWDGNGRTARLIEAVLLQTAQIKYVPKEISNYYYRNVDEYYSSFSRSIRLRKDVTPFLAFTLKAAHESLLRIKDSIVFFIRKFAVRDFYSYQKQNKKINGRQFDLLLLLLERPFDFTLRDLLERHPFSMLYAKVAEQTARRDLKKLAQDEYIIPLDNKKYRLNFYVLG